jgi:hypothetical protein
VSEDDETCKLLVWRYTGPLEDDAVPAVLLQRSTTDEAYVDGVATQRDPRTIKEEDEPATRTAAAKSIDALQRGAALNATSLLAVKTRGVCEDLPSDENGVGQECSNLKAYCNNQDHVGVTVRSNCPMSCAVPGCQLWQPMPCYPHACGPGGGPWTSKASDGNVYINYYFESNIDSKRRAVFDRAKREWESKTCLRFIERASSPAIRVAITNYNTCSSGVGNPGTDKNVDLNLGWCNDNNHFGSVVHEMGHAIGMNHEQNRPDGAQQDWTAGEWQGPYLNVKWYNIDSDWRPQWQGQKRSYTGSSTAGYAYYDYESIMHYGLEDKADATNPAWQNVPGQRGELSEGDVAQVNDMYQCAVARSPAPASSPSASGNRASTCRDAPGKHWEQVCSKWAEQGSCATSNGINQQCPGSCAEVSKMVDGYTCIAWMKAGWCPASDHIRESCPHVCDQCV